MSDYCLNCSGLIPDPHKVYGYAGPVCFCPKDPKYQYQRPASKEQKPHNTFPTERSEEALSKGNAAPSPWPPRFVIGSGFTAAGETFPIILGGGLLAWPYGDTGYLSLEEHTHLLAKAVREAKAEKEAVEIEYAASRKRLQRKISWLRQMLKMESDKDGEIEDLKATISELRKGATPENGGKE